MLDKAFFMNLLKENNGIVQSKQLAEAGIDGKILQRLEQSGEIERIGRGLYSDSNHMADDYLVTQYRCKKGIYYQETALFLHDLSDQTPFQLILTIPNGFNTRLLRDKDKNKFFYIKKERHEIGKMTVTSPYGNEIVVYNKERTIGDCLQKKEKLDTDLVLTGVRQYMKEPGGDFARLLQYAEQFNIRKLVRQYVEVLS